MLHKKRKKNLVQAGMVDLRDRGLMIPR
jgi:hypothetical protein